MLELQTKPQTYKVQTVGWFRDFAAGGSFQIRRIPRSCHGKEYDKFGKVLEPFFFLTSTMCCLYQNARK